MMASPEDPYESIRPLLWDALDLIEPEAGLLPNSDAPSGAEQDAVIVKHLQTWLPVAEGPSTERRALYYILGDKPLEGPLSLDKLEGRAQVVSQRITKICRDLEIDLFLAVLEKEDIGDPRYDPYDHYGGMGGHYDDDFGENEDEDEKEETPEPEQRDMGEIDEMNYSLKEVFDIVTGECLKSETWVDEGEIIQDADTYFEEAEPDEALDEGPGSFRQAITNYYRRPVSISQAFLVKFFYLERRLCYTFRAYCSMLGPVTALLEYVTPLPLQSVAVSMNDTDIALHLGSGYGPSQMDCRFLGLVQSAREFACS